MVLGMMLGGRGLGRVAVAAAIVAERVAPALSVAGGIRSVGPARRVGGMIRMDSTIRRAVSRGGGAAAGRAGSSGRGWDGGGGIMSTASGTVRIKLKGVKVNTLLPPAELPADLVPPEPQPAGNPAVELEIEGTPLVMRAVLNGKSVRRALKTIAEHGPDNVNVLLQGNLRPAAEPGGPYELDAPGLAVTGFR
jgi:hypothetical protein